MNTQIDDIDFLLLHTIRTADEALWKRRLTRVFNERSDTYQCLEGGISPQTVGRRIDELHENNFLEEYGVRPDNHTGILSAYRVTEDGVAALKNREEHILQEYASQFAEHCITGGETFTIPVERRRILLDMLSSKFAVDVEQLLRIRSEVGNAAFYQSVVCALSLYYLKQHVPQHARGNPVLDLLKEESREYAEKLTTHVVPREEEEQLLEQWDFTSS